MDRCARHHPGGDRPGGAAVVRTNYLEAAGLIGVDAALQKPFEIVELLRVLKSMQ